MAKGTLVRPTARTQLVASADAVIERFRAMLDWPEEDDVEVVEGDGYRSLVILPNNRLSVVWEMVEPTREDSRAGLALAKYGKGPWTIRLGVFGLDDKLDDLEKRGTRWTAIEDGPAGRRVALSREPTTRRADRARGPAHRLPRGGRWRAHVNRRCGGAGGHKNRRGVYMAPPRRPPSGRPLGQELASTDDPRISSVPSPVHSSGTSR